MTRTQIFSRLAGPSVSLGLLGGAIFLLTRSLKDLRLDELWQAMGRVPIKAMLLALGLTALSHLALSLYDYIGMRFIKSPVGYWRTLLTSFTAYSISHSLGFPAVTGGTVRYRMYTRWGLSAIDVAQVMGMAGISMFLGMFEIGGVALLFDGARVQEWSDMPSVAINLLGVVFLTIIVAYGTIGFFFPRVIKLGSFTLNIPSPRFTALQISVSWFDWLIVAAVLYVLLPPGALSFPAFLGSFVLAYLLGTLSNVPGGLGVFESIMVVSLRHSLPTEVVVSSLLVYRCIYHLVPLALGGTIFMIFEFRTRPSPAQSRQQKNLRQTSRDTKVAPTKRGA